MRNARRKQGETVKSCVQLSKSARNVVILMLKIAENCQKHMCNEKLNFWPISEGTFDIVSPSSQNMRMTCPSVPWDWRPWFVYTSSFNCKICVPSTINFGLTSLPLNLNKILYVWNLDCHVLTPDFLYNSIPMPTKLMQLFGVYI